MIGVDKTSVDKVIASAIFDLDFYQSQAGRKFDSKEAAVIHYLNEGALYKLSPHPLFDALYYLQHNEDVAKAAVNPLLHYVNQGGFEARNPSLLFHSQYYLKENPDVAASRINPLTHYLLHGGQEGRNPSLNFDSALYLRENEDVRNQQLNPLLHYVLKGRAEGRRPNSKPVIPQSVYLALRALEPMIPPYESLATLRESKESFISELGISFQKLISQIERPFSHMLLCGSQASDLDAIENLVNSFDDKKSMPLILFTGYPNKNFEQKLLDKKSALSSKCAAIISLQELHDKISVDDEIKLICRLAIQSEPHVIHGVDSETALIMFRRLHKPLSINSKLFATSTGLEFDNENIPCGSNLLLSPCADALTGIIVDSKALASALTNLIGFDNQIAQRFIVCDRQTPGSYNQALSNAGYFA